ncbi:MAG: DUF5317 family protein [Anaerolineales bacterium]|uniref:DUF5317 family protein n=1 Tax=Candidatus Villigracilis vicinus TaxID=3140679 RepID=UPI003136C7A1|nr:DUF5317 family protein [Anaerolineales bacterium]
MIVSQLLFIGFAFQNRRHLGMKILLVGALLNFTVMSANGGFMPISFETAGRLVAPQSLLDVPAGTRFGAKDILLPPEQTRFEQLADRFLLQPGSHTRWPSASVTFFIAAGAFWLLARQPHPSM